MKQLLVAVSWIACSALAATGQTEFEVASVKPAAPQALALPRNIADQIGFEGGPGSKTPDRINYRGVSLKALLARAYQLGPDQISGPGWMEIERYEILAKLPPGTDADRLRLMLQKLLSERFQIALHRKTKTLQVYRLTVAKNGPKLKPAEALPVYRDEAEAKATMRAGIMAGLERAQRGEFSFGQPRATTAKLAEVLSTYLDHPVKDMTNIEGLHSFRVQWVQRMRRADGVEPANDAPSGPSLFAAVEEQLGFKLEPAKEQLDLLVIDSALKLPTSN